MTPCRMQRLFFRLFMVFLFLAGKVWGQQKQSAFNFASVEELHAFFTWSPERLPLISAHRGGPAPGYPENCIESFAHLLSEIPAAIEYDVEITKDSVLILMHDRSLDRTTTGTGKVIEHSFEELQSLYLKDNEGKKTNFRIPTFEQTLQWGTGKTLMFVDVKRNVPFKRVVEMIEKTKAERAVIVIVYRVEDAQKVLALNPDLMLSVSARSEEDLARLKAADIPTKRMVAFTGTRSASYTLYQTLHQAGIFANMGTMHNIDNQAKAKGNHIYQKHLDVGVDIFATDRPWAVWEVLKPYYRK